MREGFVKAGCFVVGFVAVGLMVMGLQYLTMLRIGQLARAICN